jgi:glutathione transport system substrate-binding protein
METGVQTLDPHNAADSSSVSAVRAIYEPLVTFDRDLNIVGQLAESWDVSLDDKIFTFELRRGVKFQDGEDFDSSAFMVNYDRCMENKALKQHAFLAQWDSVTASDDYTVVIQLKVSNSSFLNQLTQWYLISPAAISKGVDLESSPAGTGAFKLNERAGGNYLTLAPYAAHWGGAPSVKSLSFQTVADSDSRVAMLKAGEADYIYPVPAGSISDIDGKDNIVVMSRPSNILHYVSMNCTVKELSDYRVRQALNYAVDKGAYIQQMLGGAGYTADSCVPPPIHYHVEHKPYSADTSKAKEMLADAGYGDGISLSLWGGDSDADQAGMNFIAQQLGQTGVTVNVEPMASEDLASRLNVPEEEAQVQLLYTQWSAPAFDADGSMRGVLYGTQIPPDGHNTAYWNKEEFDENLDMALSSANADDQRDSYTACQKLAWDAAPWVFLASEQVSSGRKSYCSGIILFPDGSLAVGGASLVS